MRQLRLNAYLIRASKKGDISTVKQLIQNGVDVDAMDNALINSSARGHLDVVKYLVKQGATININNDSALRWADENGHSEIVKYLVEKGADWSAIKHGPIFKEIIKKETNNLKDILTNNYITLEKSSPQINIGGKTKSQIPKSLLLKIIYEAYYQQYCSSINGNIPQIQLIALANILQQNKKMDYNLDISCVDLCDKIKHALFLLL